MNEILKKNYPDPAIEKLNKIVDGMDHKPEFLIPSGISECMCDLEKKMAEIKGKLEIALNEIDKEPGIRDKTPLFRPTTSLRAVVDDLGSMYDLLASANKVIRKIDKQK